jgi:hypothetical protein
MTSSGTRRGRAEMTQGLTPEEKAALLEALKEAMSGLDSQGRVAPKKIKSRGRGLPEPLNYQNSKTYQTGCYRSPR